MPTFLMISRHAPESCPIVHEKTRKAYIDWLSKMDEWSKKYKIKIIWNGGVMSEHLTITIFEAPSLEAQASMEPEAMAMLATETTEIKMVTSMSIEESIKMFQDIEKKCAKSLK